MRISNIILKQIYIFFTPVCMGNEYIVSVNFSGVVNARTLTRYVVPGFNGPLQFCDDSNFPPVTAFLLQCVSCPIVKSSTVLFGENG